MTQTRRAVIREGRLELPQPLDIPDGTAVLVSLRPVEEGDGSVIAGQPALEEVQKSTKGDQENRSPEDLGWPPGFFEKIAGGWQGERLQRGDQGEYENRDDLP